MKKKIYSIIISIFIIINVDCQQLPLYSQYMMNGFLINPAVAGHEGYTALNLTARKQWIGIEDAPTTYAFSMQSRLLKNSYISRNKPIKKRQKVMSRSGRVGYGIYAFTDMTGAFNRTGIQGTYSYHIPIRNSQLSFGVTLSGYQFRIDDNKIRVLDKDDMLLANTNRSAFVPDANFGVYFTNPNIYAGFSSMQLFQSSLKINAGNGAEYRMIRHYFLIAGYRFEVLPEILVEPSFLFKTTEDFISQIDFNIKSYIGEKYWFGVSYRTGGSYGMVEETLRGNGSAVILMAGLKIDKFFFGYSYDHTFNAISTRTYGSHEIMAALKFGDNARRYRWLNRY